MAAGEPCAVSVRTRGAAGAEGESLMLMPFGDLDVGDAGRALQYVMKSIAVRKLFLFPSQAWRYVPLFAQPRRRGHVSDAPQMREQASPNEQDRLGGQMVVTMCPSLRVLYRAVGQLHIATVRERTRACCLLQVVGIFFFDVPMHTKRFDVRRGVLLRAAAAS